MPPRLSAARLDYAPSVVPRGVRRTQCVSCHRSTAECGALSYRGKCVDCSTRRALDNATQLRAHSGPYFEHWRMRCLAAFGVVTLDEGRGEE